MATAPSKDGREYGEMMTLPDPLVHKASPSDFRTRSEGTVMSGVGDGDEAEDGYDEGDYTGNWDGVNGAAGDCFGDRDCAEVGDGDGNGDGDGDGDGIKVYRWSL